MCHWPVEYHDGSHRDHEGKRRYSLAGLQSFEQLVNPAHPFSSRCNSEEVHERGIESNNACKQVRNNSCGKVWRCWDESISWALIGLKSRVRRSHHPWRPWWQLHWMGHSSPWPNTQSRSRPFPTPSQGCNDLIPMHCMKRCNSKNVSVVLIMIGWKIIK